MPRPSLDDLIALAVAAGREIMAIRADGVSATKKLDGSIVTLADHRAEAMIEEGLARLAPGVPMIGEEAVAQGRIPERGDTFFCVDPLDGTRGFAKGGDEFTVNIALIERSAPVMGVVYAPASGELYASMPGRALRGKRDPRSQTSLAALSPIHTASSSPPWRIVASDFSGRNERTGAFVKALNGVATHASSSIKFCRIAEGAADLYPRFGEVSEWDVAAAHAILLAAGGDIMSLDGTPLHYGLRRDDFTIPGFVAFGGSAAANAARAAL
ncbi:MAG: 3'(2'),5'-bisphosphate nucleotidase CysQ [Proteobacteria bacterium]|nr:3'(2'),5'-bisphosphate nucleotidase CysQ [Pseudomonadota bacterium]